MTRPQQFTDMGSREEIHGPSERMYLEITQQHAERKQHVTVHGGSGMRVGAALKSMPLGGKRPQTWRTRIKKEEMSSAGGRWLERWRDARMSRDKKDGADLGSLSLKSVEYGTVRRLGEAAVLAPRHIVFVSRAQSLRTIIESVTEWFMDGFEGVALGHKDLADCQSRLRLVLGAQTHPFKGS